MSNIINYLRLISNYSTTIPSSLLTGIQHYYKLDSELTDWVGSDDATISNMTYETGKINNGVQSTNTLARLTLASTDTNFSNNTCTWSMWVKVNSLGEKVFLDIAKTSHTVPYYANEIRMDAAGKIFTATNGGSNYLFYIPPTAPAFVIGEWTHIVVVFDGGKQTIYQNGISLGDSGDVPATTTFYGTPVLIGDMLNVSGQYSTGTVFDEIGYWDRELTADEISQLYFGSVGNQYPFSTANPLTGGLQSYYKLDETSGTVATDALGNYNGTLTSGSLVSGGKINYGWNNTSSTDSGIVLGTGMNSLFDRLTPWTINMWVKRTTLGTTQLLFSNEELGATPKGMYIAIDTSNQMYMAYGFTGDVTKRIAINPISIPFATANVWQMITVTYNGSGLGSGFKFYSNATNYSGTILNDTLGTNSPVSTNTFMFGQYSRDPIYGFMGYQDEIGFWNRALTATEISELYFDGVGYQYPFEPITLETNLQHYYKFDETSGTVASDSVGTANGTLSNAVFNSSGKINYGLYTSTAGTTATNFGNNWTLSNGQARTFNVWVNPTSTGNGMIFQKNGANFYVSKDATTNRVRLLLNGGTSGSIFKTELLPALTLNAWNMVTLTYDGSGNASGMNIYVNTTLTTGTLNSNNLVGTPTATGNFHLAGWDSTGYSLIGNTDEFGVWDRALTATEITELYNSTNGLQYPFE